MTNVGSLKNIIDHMAITTQDDYSPMDLWLNAYEFV